jgi:hypothetical protein
MREGAKPLPPEVGQPGKEAPPQRHTRVDELEPKGLSQNGSYFKEKTKI